MWMIQSIVGSVIGSFICLTAERIPIGKSIITPASHCPYCKTKLHFCDLFPVISIILLKFRCRYCTHKLPVTYFLSELICGFLFIVTDFENSYCVYILIFLLTTITLALTDFFYLIVEPKLFYPFTLLLFIFHYFLDLQFHLIAGGVLFIILVSFNHIITDSIGGGDIFLLSSWAILLGSTALIYLLFIASSCALVYLLLSHFLLKQTIHQLPFVPFLTIGLFVLLYYIKK